MKELLVDLLTGKQFLHNREYTKGDRCIGFWNRNPFGWRQTVGTGRDDFTNHGFTNGNQGSKWYIYNKRRI